MSDRLRRTLRLLIDAAAVGAALVFIGTYYPSSVMLTSTTTNGGDMGTHYYPAHFLRYVLLPKGQVIGWCPGNYCGYPLFQFYFPMPFVLMAGLSAFVPFPVAFKLISALGIFLLPVCAYFSLRLAAVPFPGPALAALSTLPFLFMEANSMWGGNIPSTLAGEFSFSLGLALSLLFIGALRRTVASGRGQIWTAVLLASIGLSHGYTLIAAGFNSLIELVSTRTWWRRVWTLVAVHGLGILLMGFFLFELIGYGPWTTAYNHSWPIQQWREPMPPILWPAAIITAVTTVLVLVISLVRRTPFPRPFATYLATLAIAFFFWAFGHSLHVVDIRFWPFIQVGLGLTAAAGLAYLFSLAPVPEIWPVVGALAILPFTQSRVTFIPSWITWNYSGFEKKTTWPAFKGVNDAVSGDFRSPRVVYEHSADNESLGTVRAFENLPLFSGRSTLEGLYMQSSPSSPFVFFIQSEISKDISCPFPDYGCSRLDLDHGIGHLRMFNVSHFILRSAPVKAAAAKHPGLVHEKSVPPFEVYRVRENADRYAIPLALAPVMVVTPKWKETAYRWFKRAGPDDPTPVFVDHAGPEERAQFATVANDVIEPLPRVPLEASPQLTETLETDRITVTGCRPGHPVLIRISYHPRWRALTGERVWLAGPSFMLVVPKGDRIDLVFDGGSWVFVAHATTTLGVLIFMCALIPFTRRRAIAVGGRLAELAPQPVTAFIDWTVAWPTGTRRAVLAGGLAVFGLAAAGMVSVGHVPSTEHVYRAAQKLYDSGQLEASAKLFQQAQQIAPLSATAIHSNYFEAMVYFRGERWAEAEAAFRRLVTKFPEAPNLPEAMYHIGICRIRQGDPASARTVWQETETRFASTPWGRYAHDRLTELDGKPAGG